MSASTAGAVKAFLESLGTGIPYFRDFAPPSQLMPYGTVSDSISLNPDSSGDYGDTTADQTCDESVQVDVWQPLRNDDGTVGESYTLVDTLVAQLNGAHLPTAPTHVYGVRVDSSVRLVERDTNTVHQAITLSVHRVL